jgi:hypothetical protein
VIGDGGTGAGAGVVGTGGATDGHGVVGNGTGKGTGVKGTSPSGTGVHGSSGSTLDNATALTGVITSTTPGHGSAGVFGKNNGTGADGTGVLGMHAGTGFGVHGQSDGVGVWGESSSGTGVHGTSGSVADNASAILGEITTTSPGGFSAGVRGINDGTGVNGIGVEGTHAGSGWGVHGKSVSGVGIRGESSNGIGVHGISDSTTAGTSAIFGHITSTTPGAGSAGVRGQNDGTGNDGIGVDGLHAGSGLGVHGRSESGIGVKAEAGSAGTALHVEGKATFQRSGRVNIKAGFNGIVLHPINLTSSSKVFATAQNIIGGVFVEAAAPDPAHSRITIRLSKRVPAGFTAKVAWFILD